MRKRKRAMLRRAPETTFNLPGRPAPRMAPATECLSEAAGISSLAEPCQNTNRMVIRRQASVYANRHSAASLHAIGMHAPVHVRIHDARAEKGRGLHTAARRRRREWSRAMNTFSGSVQAFGGKQVG